MTTPALLLATTNPKKGRELAELCAARFDVVTLADVGLEDVVVDEDAPDFQGNARKKAREVRTALWAGGRARGVRFVLADDSGLCVSALDDHPGVRSARFAVDTGLVAAGAPRDVQDAANNRLLLTLLEVVPPERRQAAFVSTVCAVAVGETPDEPEVMFEATGRVTGRIARDESGAGGFGYDPVFIVDDVGAPTAFGRRMAELSSTEKHAISHRGRALASLLLLLA
jgi:XTP/dITP diphosphohydrolase